MILTTTTQKLQIKLSAAIATSNCPVVTDYVDFTSSTTTPGNTPTNTNGTTTVDFLAAPAASTQRKVNSINILNADTKATVFQIIYNDNGTTYDILTAITVPVGGTLQYTDRNGWEVITVAGGLEVVSSSAAIQEFTANGTWVKPSNCRYFLVDCVGGGGGGGGGESGGSGYVGAGGGGGKRNRMLFLSGDLPSTVTVTVASQTSNAAANAIGSVGGSTSFGSYLVAYGGGGGAFGNSSGYSGGGGGGGGTAAGSSATGTTNNGGAGGAAMLAPTYVAGVAGVASHQGAGGGAYVSNGQGSFLGGGGGAGGYSANGYTGGSSYFSAGGGGCGGSSSTATNGGKGGTTGYGNTAPNPTANGRGAQGLGPGGGGGGGGGCGNGTGGAGQAGIVRIWGW